MGICLSSSFSDENHHPAPQATAKVISMNGQLREYHIPALASQVLAHEEQEAAATPDRSSITSASSSSCFFLCDSDLLAYDDHIPAMDSDSPLSSDHIYYVLPASRLQHRLSSSDMAALAVKAALALQNHRPSNYKSNSKKTKRNNHNNNNNSKYDYSESHGLRLRLLRRRRPRVSPAVVPVLPLPVVGLNNHHHRDQAPSLTSSNEYYYEIVNSSSIKAFDHHHHHQHQQPKLQACIYPQVQPQQQPSRLASRSASLHSLLRKSRSSRRVLQSRQPKFTAIPSFRLPLSTVYEGIILL